jgi:hypothetical protein
MSLDIAIAIFFCMTRMSVTHSALPKMIQWTFRTKNCWFFADTVKSPVCTSSGSDFVDTFYLLSTPLDNHSTCYDVKFTHVLTSTLNFSWSRTLQSKTWVVRTFFVFEMFVTLTTHNKVGTLAVSSFSLKSHQLPNQASIPSLQPSVGRVTCLYVGIKNRANQIQLYKISFLSLFHSFTYLKFLSW